MSEVVSISKRILALHGVFAVAKPSGESSAQTVERIKRNILDRLREVGASKAEMAQTARKLKVGHGGTLDPLATGVLVIGIGRGCKEMHHLLTGTSKTYCATARLGQAFDTYDRTGVLTESKPFEGINQEDVERALREHFTGTIKQRPPPFSAIHVNGQRAYELARKRQRQLLEASSESKSKREKSTEEQSSNDPIVEALELPEREVTIERIKLLSFMPPLLRLEMVCTSGTYVRSLIDQLGRILGTVAGMEELERTAQGSFVLSDCLAVQETADLDRLESILKQSTSKNSPIDATNRERHQ